MDILKEIALGKQGYLVNIHSDELNRPKKSYRISIISK